MNTNFSYDRMDYYSILEYLKEQASYFSDGNWTDFSDGDVGTVLLKLMAMNADTTNFQIEKGISELYLDTVRERVNAIALCKLVGYEPRHYQSAFVEIVGTTTDMTFDSKIPAYTSFTNANGTIYFYTIEDIPVSIGLNRFKAYQGKYSSMSINVSDIDERGRVYLPEYNIGTNTFQVKQAGVILKHIENALYGEGELCYSIHIDLDNTLYIQFPTYYSTILAPNTPIEISYLLSEGINGRIGAGILDGILRLEDGVTLNYTNEYGSEGGYDPETVESIRKNAPSYAKTMDTLVTLNDFRILANEYDGISDAVALDYNFPESGLVQPTEEGEVNDAYKVNVYMLLEGSDTIVKDPDEIDESKGEYINDSNFTVDSVQNFIEKASNHTYQSKGSLSLYSGYIDDISNIKEVIIKFSATSSVEDNLRIEYADTYSYIGNVTESQTIKLSEDQLRDNGILSIYYENNSGTGSVVFSVFLVTSNEDPTKTSYKALVEKYMSDVKKKKPAGIQVSYFDVNYIRPHIVMNVYMDKDDLRYNATSGSIGAYLEEIYSRKERKIGEPVYTSHIFKEILDKFDYIQYLEITSVEYAVAGAIKPNNTQFVELLSKNITVNVLPYEGE